MATSFDLYSNSNFMREIEFSNNNKNDFEDYKQWLKENLTDNAFKSISFISEYEGDSHIDHSKANSECPLYKEILNLIQ